MEVALQMDCMRREEFARLEALYRDALLNDIIPFTLKHAPDKSHGGYYQCLDCDGSVINTDKFMWSQCRVVWIFSMLYYSLEKRPEWLDMAKSGIDFLKKYGRNPDGDWYFALDEEGKPIVQACNVFSDYFATMAFAEYSRASGDEECLEIALKTFDRIQQRKDDPKGIYNKVITKNRSMKMLAVPMININVTYILNKIKPGPEYETIIRESVAEVMNQFLDRQHRVIHENVTPDGKYIDHTYEGRHINPGHGIEAMWFIMMIAGEEGAQQTIKEACKALKWSLEFGWDKEFGGIFYFMDKYGKPHIELCWDMKLEWVHVETLVALLMGYQLTGDEELYQWFKKVHDYTWTHFPDPVYGEWYKYLNRQGQVNNRAKSNRWQNFFHLPRGLYLIWEICKGLRTGGKSIG